LTNPSNIKILTAFVTKGTGEGTLGKTDVILFSKFASLLDENNDSK